MLKLLTEAHKQLAWTDIKCYYISKNQNEYFGLGYLYRTKLIQYAEWLESSVVDLDPDPKLFAS
jgi:hypothetical protein